MVSGLTQIILFFLFDDDCAKFCGHLLFSSVHESHEHFYAFERWVDKYVSSFNPGFLFTMKRVQGTLPSLPLLISSIIYNIIERIPRNCQEMNLPQGTKMFVDNLWITFFFIIDLSTTYPQLIHKSTSCG